MSAPVNPYLSRITVEPGVRSGRPCIRDTRITVQEILRWLAAGATEDQILSDYPFHIAEFSRSERGLLVLRR